MIKRIITNTKVGAAENTVTSHFELPIDGVYLVCIVNTYNRGVVGIVQTGSYADNCSVTLLIPSNYYFSITPTSHISFDVTVKEAVGYVNVLELGRVQ